MDVLYVCSNLVFSAMVRGLSRQCPVARPLDVYVLHAEVVPVLDEPL